MTIYQPALPPWEHQERANKFIQGRASAALLMAMRTGKTYVIYRDFGQLELDNNCQDLAVIAPAGAYLNWETDALKLLSPDLLKRAYRYVWRSGSGVVAKRVLDDFMMCHNRPRILMMNIEATSSVKRAREALKNFVSARRSMGVYDESTTIKTYEAERAQFAVREIKPRTNYRRVLSGLVAPKSPLDVYMQFNYLDERILGFGSYQGFMNQYSVVVKNPVGPILRYEEGKAIRRLIPQIVAYREVASVRRKIAEHSFRVKLEDCYDMPKKMYLFRDVEWHPEQKRIYDELKEFATAELASHEHVTVQQVVVQFLRLHQVLCGHTKTEEGELREVPERRTESLLDLLEDYDGKAVIWCSYDYNVRKIADAISKRFGEFGGMAPVSRFWGGNRSTREAEERRFQEDPACRWQVATPAAAKYSRYWAQADLSIYFSNSQNLEDRVQSEERVQAVGKTVSNGYVDMRIPGTVDMTRLWSLGKKMTMATELNGDEWKEWIV